LAQYSDARYTPRVTATSRVKKAIVLGAPSALVVFSLAHGVDWLVMHGMNDENYDAFIQYIVDIRTRWLAVHLVGLVLFPLLGVAIWLMLPPARVASRISQVGLAVYIVLYAAFDAVAGIGGAVLAGYRETLPEAERPTVNGAIWSLMGEADATAYLAEAATYGWELGVLGAAVAVYQDRGWRRGLRIVVPLVLGGAAFAQSHFPPYGAVAGGLLAIAAWQFFATGRTGGVVAAVQD
jgi:hypothetical protein